MEAQMTGEIQDPWADWLLRRRHGGDPEKYKATFEDLYPVRDRVLDHASVASGDTVLDVGAGDGLIALGALERVGEQGKVIFSDISQALLDHCQALVRNMLVEKRCQFLLASAADLSALGDASVDVVTTRSVLIYVEAKQQAFREFYRVLRPRGRLSIFEPVNRFGYTELPHRFWGYEVEPIQAITKKLRAVYQRLQPVDSDPMLNFDERDLIAFAEQAGFGEIYLELRLNIWPARPIQEGQPDRWDNFLRTAGNPCIPTLEEAMQQVLTAAEIEQFVTYLRPRVESTFSAGRGAQVHLWGVKN
jgi:ubiquinone/menaquinone biosynthesis C-methylase UbiE